MRSLMLPLSLVAALHLASTVHAAAPTRPEKVAAIATVVKTWREHPKDSPASQQLSMAVAILVLEASGAADPMKPTPEEQKKIGEVVAELKAKGADPSEAVDAVLAQFKKYACKSKQSEAKATLKGLYVAQQAYFAEVSTYEKDLKKVGFDPENKSYKTELLNADKSGFKARLIGVGDMAGDEWTIGSDSHMPTAVKDLCR